MSCCELRCIEEVFEMVRLESDRLILRNYEERDQQDFFEYMSMEYTAEHEDFDPLTFEESGQYLKDRKSTRLNSSH